MDENSKESHESYGMLSISRLSGHDTVLFGSSIPHRNTIRLSIHPGVVERSLNHDHYYAERKPYIEVEMSQAQFAEAITSMNMGSGVPVTLRELNGKLMEKPSFTSKRMQFEQEFKERMENLESHLARLTEKAEDILRNKKSVNKTDRHTILNELNALKRELASNMPFIASSYNEQMDKTTQEAKAELEAFTINKLNQLGLEKWKEQQDLPVSQDPLQQLTQETNHTEQE
ncbi:hypothetical protein [Evansella clarkii]|uniref:hypothetical protein n=1 Tax=Evansella clarkii TaxID=79879 RepID=UPI0009969BF3|nr:hypothetical protein [Evansella clarkii]